MGNQEKDISSYRIVKYRGWDIPASYHNMIFAKWMRSYKYGNDYIKLIDSDSYFESYTKYITQLLSRPDTLIRLAVLSDDDDVVLGFSVIERDILHYVFTGKDFRKNGIATMLVPTEIGWLTHLTKTGLKLWAKKLFHARFNPFT